jgi:hypothetical protein
LSNRHSEDVRMCVTYLFEFIAAAKEISPAFMVVLIARNALNIT